MVKDSEPLGTLGTLGTLGGPSRASSSLPHALEVVLEEAATLTPKEAARSQLDVEQLPAFADHVRGLVAAGQHERAARVLYAALSLVLRAHARELLHPASATMTHRAAVDRVGAAMHALTQEHGERARSGKVEDGDLPGLRAQRRRRRIGRGRS